MPDMRDEYDRALRTFAAAEPEIEAADLPPAACPHRFDCPHVREMHETASEIKTNGAQWMDRAKRAGWRPEGSPPMTLAEVHERLLMLATEVAATRPDKSMTVDQLQAQQILWTCVDSLRLLDHAIAARPPAK